MAVRLNRGAEAHARSLIASGNCDDEASWSFTAADENKLLGPNGDNWANYARFHLGEDTAAAEQTKARYKYPYGKDAKVYGQALRAIRSRASQQDAAEVYAAAGRLLDQIGAKEGDGKPETEEQNRVLPFRNRAKAPLPSGYKALRNAAGDGEIYLYGVIGDGGFFGPPGISADQFRQDLKSLGNVKTIDLRINSDGGDVFDGKAIYSLLLAHPATVNVHVDGLAASAASFVAMAGASISMAESGFMMIHNAYGGCFGGAEDMRSCANLLDMINETIADVYAARSGQPREQVTSWMNDETWMTGQDCLARGFCDKLVANQKIAASVRDPARFRNLPRELRPNRARAQAMLQR